MRGRVSTLQKFSRQFSTEQQYEQFVLRTYDRFPIDIVSGEGARIFDRNGKTYLDFGAGIAVNALGYNHPKWVEVVQKQASKLCHVSNLFYTSEQGDLAEKLVDSCCLEKAFFCNSGAEANEAAIKFSRRYARNVFNRDDKNVVIGFSGSFHGRTFGSLSLTANKKYRDPFEPLLPGTKFGEFNSIESVNELIDDKVCAVLVEPIQGEGGVNPAKAEFLQHIRKKTEEVGALMVADEVQCGFGRLGKLWGHGLYNIKPDIMTIAKPLAGGLPIGAVMLRNTVAEHIQPGDHGTTFGGNALICAVGCEMMDIINTPSFLNHVNETGEELARQIHEKIATLPAFKELRHIGGLMCGIELHHPVKDVLQQSRDDGVVFLNAGANVIRLLPPLIIGKDEVTEAIDVLAKHISTIEAAVVDC